MKRTWIWKGAGVALGALCLVGAVCAFTVTGSGFLDLSNLVRGACGAAALVCALLAWVCWKKGT